MAFSLLCKLAQSAAEYSKVFGKWILTFVAKKRRNPSNLQLLGANCLTARTAWSSDQKQLVVTYQIKTKQGKEGQLIVRRHLINEGENRGRCFHPKAQHRTRPNFSPPNLAQASLSLVNRDAGSIPAGCKSSLRRFTSR